MFFRPLDLLISLLAIPLVMIALAGCHPQDMDPLEQQPKYKPYSKNTFYGDGRAMRAPPEGTVPRERNLVEERPPEKLDAQFLALGRESYERTCQVCHGLVGDGDTVVSSKMGLRTPPSLHSEHARGMSADEIYRVISEGYGLMPRYATVLKARERWAAVAYVRALQLSQHTVVAEAPEDVRRQLEGK